MARSGGRSGVVGIQGAEQVGERAPEGIGGGEDEVAFSRGAVEVPDATTGLQDEDPARGDVPGCEAPLEEGIDPSGGHVGEVEGGPADASDVADGRQQLDEADGLTSNSAPIEIE
jgi:hypothetical protein